MWFKEPKILHRTVSALRLTPSPLQAYGSCADWRDSAVSQFSEAAGNYPGTRQAGQIQAATAPFSAALCPSPRRLTAPSSNTRASATQGLGRNLRSLPETGHRPLSECDIRPRPPGGFEKGRFITRAVDQEHSKILSAALAFSQKQVFGRQRALRSRLAARIGGESDKAERPTAAREECLEPC